ncbi:hypothetical protein EG329_000297 [Mollisiaceae sp. DMI_Dod_QoI]|nr:hypothetical protein EG329_000297 [Helotiales sp. DMI_Dod_QoI]
MQITLALAALASVASAAVGSTPTASAPSGCATSYSGQFEITIINSTTTKRDLEVKRQSSTCGKSGYLTVSLSGGILTDAQNRQGYIASNSQFQFNTPVQENAIYTGGFSVCSNGSLALGGSSVFWECLTTGGPGIGTYYNLYSASTGAQCQPILIDIIPCSDTGSTGVVGQSSDGQPTGTSVGSVVSQITDGQPQATGTPGSPPVSQISDGQVQGTTVAPQPTACVVSQISDGQAQVTICPTTAVPVSQISDGQVQATSAGAPVSQISDGQVQATSAGAPVSQISDGQVQATTAGAPVSQISDGQVQATTAGAPVSQISDGQVQATTAAPVSTSSALAVVSQISDGQPQAPNATTTPLQVAGNSGNGLTIASTFGAVMFGLVAVFLL